MTSTQIITDEAVLKQIIAEQAPAWLEEVRREVGDLEVEYKLARGQQKRGLLMLIGGFVVAPLLSFHPILTFLSTIAAVLLIYTGLKNGVQSHYVITRFTRSLDAVLFTKIFSLFGVSGSLFDQSTLKDPATIFTGLNTQTIRNLWAEMQRKSSPAAESVLATLIASELITEPHNQNRVDTGMKLNASGTDLTVAELDIEHVTGSGKNRHTKQIFHGYFATLKLTRALTGKTFVSTEGDTSGFGGVSFWNKSSQNLPKETILEWNEFEDMLHVATTNETEARYVLTPNFMHDLYDWWKEQKTNIRLAFHGDQMYMLFPDEQIKLWEGITSDLTADSLAEYVYTIARPLWHILRLTEKVRL